MSENEVFVELKQVLVDRLGVEPDQVREEVGLFEELGLDSIDLMTAVMVVEEKFGIEVADNELEQIETLGDAVRLLSDKVGALA